MRSEGNIITLVPVAQQAARQFLKIFTEAKKDVRIISGTHTYAEQDTLYRQGRFGNPGPIVTKARGGQSNHNFGIAWDIGLFENGNYITTDNEYKALPNLVLPPHVPGLEWGGNWVGFPDFPHYQQKALFEKISQIKTLFEDGQPYV